ncbi:MAG: membrane protein insertion efficiency factor YidD [Clostridiaceae bacterium]|nr:membrane protein insertion efficiency factor YidD [Clostridiaceae bacterium]
MNKEKSSPTRTGRHGTGQPSIAASGLLALISFYRTYLSPAHPACCRFSPSCSAYASQAIRTHGALKGSLLSLWRLLRCQPLCKGGYDPVPEKKIRGHAASLSHQGGIRSDC